MNQPVFILGAGRAGRGLARALRASGSVDFPLIGVHGRQEEDVPERITSGPIPPETLVEATVVIVAVRDDQLDDALEEIASAGMRADAIILQASGSAVPRGFVRLRAQGHACGTFHPMVPLADPALAAENLRGAWIGVDGDPRAQDTARLIAGALGAHTLEIPAGEKGRYHAAAVFASNFPIVLAALAGEMLRDAGVADSDAYGATQRLMAAAVANLGGRSPADALTGPIVRGDVETIRAHLRALSDSPSALAAYRALTAAGVELARGAGLGEGKLDNIARALSDSAPTSAPVLVR